MALRHGVYDSDTHFSINPTTRVLKNEGSTKNTLIQYDHNSERVTFEIPRTIEGHDMSLCNRVEVHYNNIDAQTKVQSHGVYTVDDMQISPEDENVVILSWLISHNATRYVGSLNFLIRLSCVEDDGTISYAWNTAVYSGISVSTGIYNSKVVLEEYADVLEEWDAKLEDTIYGVMTAAEMDEILANATVADVGAFYMYLGETTASYENGAVYRIGVE